MKKGLKAIDQVTQQEPQIAGTISPLFIQHVATLFSLSFRPHQLLPESRKEGDNHYSAFAVPAYMCAAAAVESYINETFLSEFSIGFFPQSPLKHLKPKDLETIERMKTAEKVLFLPLLVYSRPIDRARQAYADFDHLLKLRNGLTHYKFRYGDEGVTAPVKDLAQRKIAFSDRRSKPRIGDDPCSTWVEQVSTTEGIRWAYNTAISMIHLLIDAHPTPAEVVYERSRWTSMAKDAAKREKAKWAT
jgi:hypothetical protein